MRLVGVAVLVFAAACSGADPGGQTDTPPVAEDPNDALADADPGTGLDLDYQVAVVDTGLFGPLIEDPAGIVTAAEAQGEWAGVQVEWETTGEASLQPYAQLLGAEVTDGTSTWTVDAPASTLLTFTEGGEAPTSDVGPGMSATFWVAADVPEGTEVTGVVIGGVTYTAD